MNCTVSILIPAYNAERWVGSALQSALNQSWPRIEIIVVDDGSRDQTLAVAKRYESAKVKVMRQEAERPAARNTALREAQGDFLQYLDADDLLSADKIREQLILLRENPDYLSVSSGVYFFDGKDPNSGLEERSGAVDTDDPVKWLMEFLGPDGPFGTVPYGAWLTPRSVAERAGAWDDSVHCDDDGEYFCSGCAGKSWYPRLESRPILYYRRFVQGGSFSTTYSEVLLRGRLHSLNCKAKGVGCSRALRS